MNAQSSVDVVVWLVRDTCRLQDNPALDRAVEEAKTRSATVLALACLEPRRWKDEQFGCSRSGAQWRRFRAESLVALRESLERKKSGLWIAAGAPSDVISTFPPHIRVTTVVTDLPVAPDEQKENASLVALGLEVLAVQVDELFDAGQIKNALDQLPSSFTKFRKTIEKKQGVTPPEPIGAVTPSALLSQPWKDPDDLATALAVAVSTSTEVEARGGEVATQKIWRDYLESGALSSYKKTRNAFFGRTQSSHLSAWLAHGCLSARMMWWDILDYEQQNGANESTYWLRFELLWREFFRWYSREAGFGLFRREGPSGQAVVYQENPAGFSQWCGGQTGVNIIDAAMRELAQTGWLSNRARQLAASYLIYDLNLDWRLGAAWFESQLVDFDVASNWGNWAYIAGVGPDPRGGRIFNVESQAERYDSDQHYRTRWLNSQ